MRAFSVLQERPKMAKMTPNDLVALKIVLNEPRRNTEQNILLISKNSTFSSNKSEKTILTVILLTIRYGPYGVDIMNYTVCLIRYELYHKVIRYHGSSWSIFGPYNMGPYYMAHIIGII